MVLDINKIQLWLGIFLAGFIVLITCPQGYAYDSFYAKKIKREREVFQALNAMESVGAQRDKQRREKVKEFENQVARQAYQQATHHITSASQTHIEVSPQEIKEHVVNTPSLQQDEQRTVPSDMSIHPYNQHARQLREDYFPETNTDHKKQKPVQPEKLVQVRSSLGVGYRHDYLNWTIAGTDNVPNILSELTWDNVKSRQVLFDNEVIIKDQFVIEGKAAVSNVYEGDNQDSDFLYNHRLLEFSRSNNDASDGDMRDLSAGVGVRYPLVKGEHTSNGERKDLHSTFLVGYSYHEQNFVMKDGNQTIPATGAFPGLHSSYETQWHGPWMGMKFDGEYEKWRGFTRLEYHWADYYAEANWNLRSDFQHPKSYEHETRGTGMVFALGGGYWLQPWWSVDLSYQLTQWDTEIGVDRTFFSNGTVGETRLNEVQWESYSVNLASTLHF